MENPAINVLIMIIASILIGYYLTMTIILTDRRTNNRNKAYQALLMGFWMGLIELVMVGILMGVWLPVYNLYLIGLVLGIVILTVLIRYQVGIDENQFLLGMIEHHAMALEMVKNTEKNASDPRVVSLMKNILSSQEREIREMEEILRERGVSSGLGALLA